MKPMHPAAHPHSSSLAGSRACCFCCWAAVSCRRCCLAKCFSNATGTSWGSMAEWSGASWGSRLTLQVRVQRMGRRGWASARCAQRAQPANHVPARAAPALHPLHCGQYAFPLAHRSSGKRSSISACRIQPRTWGGRAGGRVQQRAAPGLTSWFPAAQQHARHAWACPQQQEQRLHQRYRPAHAPAHLQQAVDLGIALLGEVQAVAQQALLPARHLLRRGASCVQGWLPAGLSNQLQSCTQVCNARKRRSAAA